MRLIQTVAAVLWFLAAVCLLTLVVVGPAAPQEIGDAHVITREADGTECHEDEPCWDCATMGNLICGTPAAEPVEAAPTFTG